MVNERIQFWKDFRKTSLQQFARSGANTEKHILFLLDPRDDFAVDLVLACYPHALKEPHADPDPSEDLGTLAIIGAPYVLVLEVFAAMTALEQIAPNTALCLSEPPPPGQVRIVILQDTNDGPGCTFITDQTLPRLANCNKAQASQLS